ncbi:hypothetical protein ID866_1231 [Astraeus odoratus]|nr:hypothetical protein ID866_1231 [Astraeus odoratus]
MNCIKRIPLITARLSLPRPLVPLRGRRAFSSTPRVRAIEQDNTFLHDFQNTSVFRKIADKPEALSALRDFAALLKEKGIDATLGPPSTTQMLRLAASSDFRKAAQRVVDELKNAGLDLTSQVKKHLSSRRRRLKRVVQDVMQELMALSKKPGSS